MISQCKLFFAFLFLILPALIFADGIYSRINQIGFYLGGENNFIRDQQSSPLVYRGVKLFPFHIVYKNRNGRHITTVNVYRSKFSAKSEFNHKSEVNYYNFQLSYLQNINKFKNSKWDIFVGAAWQNQVIIYNYYFGKSYFNTWLFFSSSNLSAQVLLSNQMSESSMLQVGVSIPIVAYIIRSGYVFPYPDKLTDTNNYDPSFWDVFKSGDFATVDRFRGVTINFEYTKIVSDHLMLGLTYNFSYLRDYKHFLFRTATNDFAALISFIW